MPETVERGKLRLLDVQYEGSEVLMLDEELPDNIERIHYREGVEALIKRAGLLTEKDTVALKRTRLTRKFQPVTFDWQLVSNVASGASSVEYSYLLEGNHGDVGFTDVSVLMRTEFDKDGVVQFSEIVAEYENKGNGWLMKEGWVKNEKVDDFELKILDKLGYTPEEGEEIGMATNSAVYLYMSKVPDFEEVAYSGVLQFSEQTVQGLKVVFEDEMLAVTFDVELLAVEGKIGELEEIEIYTAWVKV